jgi:uncharacterized iron-regulated membrane protein
MADLHVNLLAGATGKTINGIMAIFVVLLSLSGLIIWWPGRGRLRRSLTIDFRSNWKRLNWDLHSVVGFWMFALIFVWGVTGVYLVFPTPFQRAVNKISPLKVYTPVDAELQPLPDPLLTSPAAPVVRVADGGAAPQPPRRRRRPPRGSNGDVFLRWFYYLHFGNFSDWGVKTLWVILGLVPPFLFITGALMWWNRVLSREARVVRRRRGVPAGASVAS